MTRFARLVVPGAPHHVIQRGNRKQTTFFSDADYRLYLTLLTSFCVPLEVAIWSYCLMPNHVHLIMVPKTAASLARAFGRTHEAYTRIVNGRNAWRGYLWQGRFRSFPMDEVHLHFAARYILRNPVSAGLVARPELWKWSSAKAHLEDRPDGVVDLAPLKRRIDDWPNYLATPVDEGLVRRFRIHERTGRPLGSDLFIDELESQTGRVLHPRRPGPVRGGKRRVEGEGA